MTNRAKVINAALSLCSELLFKESLRHPKHTKKMKPITERVRKLMASYFRHQKRAILLAIKYKLAEANGKSKALKLLPDSVSPLSFPVTSSEDQDFSDAMRDAVNAGAVLLAKELQSGAVLKQTAMDRYLEENSLSKLTGGFEETTKQRLRNAIANAVDEGADAEGIVEAIHETMDEFSTVRAEMIAQTETNNAYNFGRQEIAVESGMTEKSWVTESGDPCPECIDNEDAGWLPIGMLFPSGDEMPTAHPRCLPAGVLVTAKCISGAVRRLYKGEVCKISIAGNPDLTITPNHPVLTSIGWRPAGELNPGDYVLQRVWPSSPSPFQNPDDYHVETGIDKIFDSLFLAGTCAASGMPITAEAFHGDARLNDEIDIVWPACHLANDRDVIPDYAKHRLLGFGHACGIGYFGTGDSGPLLDALLSSPGGAVRGLRELFSLFCREFRLHDTKSFLEAALLDAKGFPLPENGGPADSSPYGYRQQALTSGVKFVKVDRVERFSFDGHVYNLETQSGCYTANSIVVHNCYCSLDFRTAAEPVII